MTCIVGYVEDGTIYMGADSAGVGGLTLDIRADEKVFRNGEFLMGFTSSYRMGQLLCYKFTPPVHPPKMSVEKYMVSEFVEAVRKCLADGGYQTKKDEVTTGGCFLVGYRGRIFEIWDNYQVAWQRVPFNSVGCAQDIAKGALQAMCKVNRPVTARSRVVAALQIAEQFSAGVRGPFKVLKLKSE